MNSVLSYIAAFIVVVLFAALIGPSFVDWNSFRGEIESRLSEATGWQAEVSGDIHFVLQPRPRRLQTSAPWKGKWRWRRFCAAMSR